MIRIDLPRHVFADRPTVVAATSSLRATAFRHACGAEALRIETPRLDLLALPYRGQQVWRVDVDGAPMGMRGMTAEPRAGTTLLDTFGAFLFHCGLLGTAAPGPEDDHELHGELPLAPMDAAWLEVSEGSLRLCGTWEFARAFRAHYRWSPSVAMRADATTLTVEAQVENLGAAFPFMYLMHPNFRPVDGARLHYAAPYDAGAVRVRAEVPAHLGDRPGYAEGLAALARDPALHHHLVPGLPLDPEAVFLIDYRADDEGFAHALQVHPDGRADWAAHRPAECPVAPRWISRTPDQDAIALTEPSTSGLTGFAAERRAGRVPVLAAGATWRTEVRMGRLDAGEARAMVARVDRIAGRG